MNKVIKLIYPITVKRNGQEEALGELTLGRLKAKHLKLLPKEFLNQGENESEEGTSFLREDPYLIVPILAALANITEEEAGELDLVEDLPRVSEEVGNFLSTSLETGKK